MLLFLKVQKLFMKDGMLMEEQSIKSLDLSQLDEEDEDREDKEREERERRRQEEKEREKGFSMTEECKFEEFLDLMEIF